MATKATRTVTVYNDKEQTVKVFYGPKGDTGPQGESYNLTTADKEEIAELAEPYIDEKMDDATTGAEATLDAYVESTIQPLITTAQTAATNAGTYADNASDSADEAAASATTAQTAANTATGAISNIGNYVSQAQEHANNASSYAIAAYNSAQDAGDAAADAITAKSQAQSLVDAFDATVSTATAAITSAQTSAIGAVESARDSAILDIESVYADDMAEVNAKVSRNTKEIANLVQKEGVVSVSYPDSIYGNGEVPAGMAKFAEVSCLRGVSRVENQLVNLINLRASFSQNGLTFTNNGDGSFTINGTSTDASGSYTDYAIGISACPYVSGRTYLAGIGNKIDGLVILNLGGYVTFDYAWVATAPASGNSNIQLRIYGGKTFNNFKVQPNFTDLNIYFGTSDLSFLGATDSDKLATIQRDYPELLVPSDYDTGTRVDTTYSAVRAEGNLIDESSYGLISEISRYGLVADVDEGFFTLSGTAGQSYATGLYVNGNLTDIENVNGTFSRTFNVSEPCKLMLWINSSTNYLSNVMLNRGMVANPHCAYMPTHTLTLPEPVTLRSAGSVADTDELCVEVDGVEKRKQTVRVGSYTFTGNETPTSSYQRTNGDWYCVFQSIFNGGKDGGEGLSSMGIPFTTGSVAYDGTGTYFVIRGSGGLAFYLAGATSASAVMAWISANLPKVYYELATPVVTLTDPILDNFVLTEAGGTITPKQTQTKQIDTSFDMNYMAL